MASSSAIAGQFDALRDCVIDTTEAFREGVDTGRGYFMVVQNGQPVLSRLVGNAPGMRRLADLARQACKVAAANGAVSSYTVQNNDLRPPVRAGAIRLGDGIYVAFISHGETEEDFLKDEARIVACAYEVGLLDEAGMQAIIERSDNGFVAWALDRVRSVKITSSTQH